MLSIVDIAAPNSNDTITLSFIYRFAVALFRTSVVYCIRYNMATQDTLRVACCVLPKVQDVSEQSKRYHVHLQSAQVIR